MFGLFSTMALAQIQPVVNQPTQNPYQTMQQVVKQTFPKLKALHQQHQLTPSAARQIIINNVMPYIDYRYAAFMVIGRNLPKTTREQRQRFVLAFYHYLVTTYSQALGKYNEQKVAIEQPRPYDGETVMTVPALITEQGRPPIHLQFKFRKLQKGGWLAYDMIAEGVSLLATNQSEVGALIQQKGIDAVSKMLEQKQLQDNKQAN